MTESKPPPPAPPELSAPMRPLIVATIAAALVAGAIAALIALALRPAQVWAAPLAALVILVASAASLAFVAAQGRQTIVAWSGKWLAGSAIRAAATLLLAALAYLLLRPDPITYALSLLGGYIAVLIVETMIFTAALKRTYKADSQSAQEK